MEKTIKHDDPEHGQFSCTPATLSRVAGFSPTSRDLITEQELRSWAENATDGSMDLRGRDRGALLVIVASLVDERLDAGMTVDDFR